MATSFQLQIEDSLGTSPMMPPRVTEVGLAELPSCFRVSDLAVATMTAAAKELALLIGAREITIDRRLASLWFDMTLRPQGWDLPDAWDAIAGVYQVSDGWIRLHTNAPHHKRAALSVLDCSGDKHTVAAAVADWRKSQLEEAIIGENGAAAAMHSLAEWAAHPQGKAVSRNPLIAWDEVSEARLKIDLHDIKVLDLTRVLAGPVATRFLAGFGAHVLRIDPPWWSEPGVEPEVTLGKRRAGLDLKHAEDRRTFEALLTKADVLVHGYRPGALSGLGYDPTSLRKIAPEMIDISLCAYGLDGPWVARRGFDSLVQMSCGIAHEGMVRARTDRPVPLPVQALDHATGYLMAAATLRAIRDRNETGRVLSARLSLARTAALLFSDPVRDFRGSPIEAACADLSEDMELTSWGPAQRIRFPMLIDGAEANWRIPSGELRCDPATW